MIPVVPLYKWNSMEKWRIGQHVGEGMGDSTGNWETLGGSV